MLVSDFVQIVRPFAEVRKELATSGPAWLADSAVAAYAEGEQLSMRVFSAIGPVRVSKRVSADLGEPIVRRARITQPLTWRATGATSLFPSMDAEIEVTPMGDSMTSISFQGSYVPPLGPLGRSADRMLLHRFAEASVRALLERIAQHLEGTDAAAAVSIGNAQTAPGQ